MVVEKILSTKKILTCEDSKILSQFSIDDLLDSLQSYADRMKQCKERIVEHFIQNYSSQITQPRATILALEVMCFVVVDNETMEMMDTLEVTLVDVIKLIRKVNLEKGLTMVVLILVSLNVMILKGCPY